MPGGIQPGRRQQLQLIAVCVAAIATSAASTLVLKSAYQTVVQGRNFAAPIFMEVLTGVAMSLSLVAFAPSCFRRCCFGERRPARSVRHYLPLLVLATSDLTVGLGDCLATLYAPASILSISNCSILCFGAVATRCVMGTRYSTRQWSGIGIAAIGVIVTGTAVLFYDAPSSSSITSSSTNSSTTTAKAPLGVALSLGARALQAVQFSFEERYMKSGRYTPLFQVGAEGIIETTLCAFVVLPLADALHFEDFGETTSMLQHSPTLCVLCALSVVFLGLLNPLSMSIGQQHGSVLRVFMDLGRPAVVWGVSLIAYRLSGGGYGETWSSPRSWIELGGFATLFAGLALYCSGGKPQVALHDAAVVKPRAAAAGPAGMVAVADAILGEDQASRGTGGGGAREHLLSPRAMAAGASTDLGAPSASSSTGGLR